MKTVSSLFLSCRFCLCLVLGVVSHCISLSERVHYQVVMKTLLYSGADDEKQLKNLMNQLKVTITITAPMHSVTLRETATSR